MTTLDKKLNKFVLVQQIHQVLVVAVICSPTLPTTLNCQKHLEGPGPKSAQNDPNLSSKACNSNMHAVPLTACAEVFRKGHCYPPTLYLKDPC